METHVETEGWWHILLGQGLLSHSHGLVGNGKNMVSAASFRVSGLRIAKDKRKLVHQRGWCNGAGATIKP